MLRSGDFARLDDGRLVRIIDTDTFEHPEGRYYLVDQLLGDDDYADNWYWHEFVLDQPAEPTADEWVALATQVFEQ